MSPYTIRLREGKPSGGVAVVTHSMGNKETGLVGVNDVKEALGAQGIQVKIFEPSKKANDQLKELLTDYRKATGIQEATTLPDDWVIKSQMYEVNKQWILKNLENGMTFVDVGNPNQIDALSSFYELEKLILFGGGK
jgi:hypothetical protein